MPKISLLTELPADTLAADDLFVVTDTSAGTDKYVQASDIMDAVVSTYGVALLGGASVAAVLSAMNVDTFIQGALDDADADAVLTTLGLDTDLLTLDLPANVTVSTFGATITDDADADAVKATIGSGDGWTYLSQVAVSGASTADITGIPSGVGEVQVLVNGISVDDPDNLDITLGGAGGFDTAGYSGSSDNVDGAQSDHTSSAGAWAIVNQTVISAACAFHGIIRIVRWDLAEHAWFWQMALTNQGDGMIANGAGRNTMSEELTQIRFECRSGVDEWDAGEIRARYK